MSEAEFWIFNAAFSAGVEILHAAYLAVFLYPFMRGRAFGRLKAGALFLGYLLVSRILAWLAAPQFASAPLLIVLLTAAARFLGLKGRLAFWLGLLYWNAKTAGGLMAQCFYFLAASLLPALAERPEALYLRSAILLTLLLLAHAVLLALMLLLLLRRIQKRPLSLNWRELCYLSLLPLAGILFGQVISSLLFEVKDGVLLELYGRHPAFLAAVPALALLFYTGAYLTIFFQQKIAALQEEQAVHYVNQQQMQAIQARIQEAEKFYADVRQLKHEMRGHLTNIKGLAQSGAYSSLDEYIARIDEDISSFKLLIQTGNPVTDIIVNDKRQQCLDLGVDFRVDFHYPEQGKYDAFDVGVILQNLLQNALEACARPGDSERYISLTGKRRAHFFLIEVKNSLAEEVVFGKDGLPLTTKNGKDSLHGIGLANVRRAAERYMGELEVKAEAREFSATVLLQERS